MSELIINKKEDNKIVKVGYSMRDNSGNISIDSTNTISKYEYEENDTDVVCNDHKKIQQEYGRCNNNKKMRYKK